MYYHYAHNSIKLFLGLLFFSTGCLYFLYTQITIDLNTLNHYEHIRPTIVLDDAGKEWTRFTKIKRSPVAYSALPQHLINAFVAAEDWQFFTHKGLSFRGMVRSLCVNLYHGKRIQGASTISQQLVKMLFLDSRKTFKRKLKEQWYALIIERQCTKEHILEAYCNNVYFGSGVYGVQAAANLFFGVSVENITIDQAALLAGIVRSPRNYSPYLFPLSCKERRTVILQQMVKCHFITMSDYEIIKNTPLVAQPLSTELFAPYVREMIRLFLEERFGKETIYNQGLIVQSTLNSDFQKKAETAFNKQHALLQKKIGEDIQGGLVSIDVVSGGIKALVGGSDFRKSPLNRVTQTLRQQGSVFKPLVYATALEKGFSVADMAIDEPISISFGNQTWEPRNHTRTHEGPMTLARALAYSNNSIACKLMMEIGPKAVVENACKCHVSNTIIKPYPSLALGCIDSSLLDVAGMFNIFANDGYYVQPHCIEWIKDCWGKKIYTASTEKERVFNQITAQKIVRVLQIGIERQRKKGTLELDSQACGKTGTTNDSRTCWFAGSTPELTTVVYTGFDDNRFMGKNIFPLTTAYPSWLDFHQNISTTKKQFNVHASLCEEIINIKTGERINDLNDPDAFTLLM